MPQLVTEYCGIAVIPSERKMIDPQSYLAIGKKALVSAATP